MWPDAPRLKNRLLEIHAHPVGNLTTRRLLMAFNIVAFVTGNCHTTRGQLFKPDTDVSCSRAYHIRVAKGVSPFGIIAPWLFWCVLCVLLITPSSNSSSQCNGPPLDSFRHRRLSIRHPSPLSKAGVMF